ncbi:MAG: ABC transporter ATP-binding protein [Candidatus Bathyarchaeia archaeon]|jgi:iron complex transport system ATP-binding protein
MNITVQEVTFSYKSTKNLNAVSLQLQKSEVLGLIGPNGSGKTTLIKCINKILEPKQGKILLGEQEIKTLSRTQIANHIGYVPQSSVYSQDVITVFEVVMMGRRPHITWQSSEKDAEKVWSTLKTLGVEHLAMRNYYELSGGEQQRILMARALAQEAKVLLLDEPTSSLDIKHQLEVMELTRQLVKNENLSAMMAIHDLNLAARFCDKIVMLKRGEIYAAGEAKTVLNIENIKAVYDVNVEINYSNNIPYVIPLSAIN